jgi:hypothetical protein
LSTSKITISEVNTDLPGLDRLLKQKQRLRKLWQEIGDPACNTAVNWVAKAIRWMIRRRALKRWETKIANTDVTPQTIRPIENSLMKRDGPKEPLQFMVLSGLTFLQLEKANEIADCLENQFTPHDL